MMDSIYLNLTLPITVLITLFLLYIVKTIVSYKVNDSLSTKPAHQDNKSPLLEMV